MPKVPEDPRVWVRSNHLVIHLQGPGITYQQAHLALMVLKKAEERMLGKLVCQNVELGQAGQGRCRDLVILMTLHMLKVDGYTW